MRYQAFKGSSIAPVMNRTMNRSSLPLVLRDVGTSAS
jgi:hypothetical protein